MTGRRRSFPPEVPEEGPGDCDGMSRRHADPAQNTSRFVEDAELPQDGSAVIVDSFTGQAVIGVEGVHAAERELDAPPGGRKATPGAEVCAANHDFHENGFLRHMPPLDPRLIVVARRFTKGTENALEVVVVLQANVLLDDGHPS